MCLIVFAWRAHPEHALVLAANRDEYLARPALPACWWQDAPELLCGRDLEAGGSWMGLSANGRFAALTNYRDPDQQIIGAPSRGALVRAVLESALPALEVLQQLAADRHRYPGFNLLAGDGDTLAILESTTGSVRALAPGIYGLSNHLLDSPWPKLVRTRTGLAAVLADGGPDEEALLRLLRDRTIVDDEYLPTTGVTAEWERWLSAAFIRAPGYGTRCSTVVTVKEDGCTRLREWTWDEDGALQSEVRHCFKRRPPGPLQPRPLPAHPQPPAARPG